MSDRKAKGYKRRFDKNDADENLGEGLEESTHDDGSVADVQGSSPKKARTMGVPGDAPETNANSGAPGAGGASQDGEGEDVNRHDTSTGGLKAEEEAVPSGEEEDDGTGSGNDGDQDVGKEASPVKAHTHSHFLSDDEGSGGSDEDGSEEAVVDVDDLDDLDDLVEQPNVGVVGVPAEGPVDQPVVMLTATESKKLFAVLKNLRQVGAVKQISPSLQIMSAAAQAKGSCHDNMEDFHAISVVPYKAAGTVSNPVTENRGTSLLNASADILKDATVMALFDGHGTDSTSKRLGDVGIRQLRRSGRGNRTVVEVFKELFFDLDVEVLTAQAQLEVACRQKRDEVAGGMVSREVDGKGKATSEKAKMLNWLFDGEDDEEGGGGGSAGEGVAVAAKKGRGNGARQSGSEGKKLSDDDDKDDKNGGRSETAKSGGGGGGEVVGAAGAGAGVAGAGTGPCMRNERVSVGSTALFAAISGLPECPVDQAKVVVANAGDCRAILSKRGIAYDLSTDHKVKDEDRDAHSIGVFRSIGDLLQKDWDLNYGADKAKLWGVTQKVTSEPDVTESFMTAGEDILILASDGVLDFMGGSDSQPLVTFVGHRMIATSGNLAMVANEVVAEAGRLGSTDDRTCIIVCLKDLGGVAEQQE